MGDISLLEGFAKKFINMVPRPFYTEAAQKLVHEICETIYKELENNGDRIPRSEIIQIVEDFITSHLNNPPENPNENPMGIRDAISDSLKKTVLEVYKDEKINMLLLQQILSEENGPDGIFYKSLEQSINITNDPTNTPIMQNSNTGTGSDAGTGTGTDSGTAAGTDSGTGAGTGTDNKNDDSKDKKKVPNKDSETFAKKVVNELVNDNVQTLDIKGGDKMIGGEFNPINHLGTAAAATLAAAAAYGALTGNDGKNKKKTNSNGSKTNLLKSSGMLKGNGMPTIPGININDKDLNAITTFADKAGKVIEKGTELKNNYDKWKSEQPTDESNGSKTNLLKSSGMLKGNGMPTIPGININDKDLNAITTFADKAGKVIEKGTELKNNYDKWKSEQPTDESNGTDDNSGHGDGGDGANVINLERGEHSNIQMQHDTKGVLPYIQTNCNGSGLGMPKFGLPSLGMPDMNFNIIKPILDSIRQPIAEELVKKIQERLSDKTTDSLTVKSDIYNKILLVIQAHLQSQQGKDMLLGHINETIKPEIEKLTASHEIKKRLLKVIFKDKNSEIYKKLIEIISLHSSSGRIILEQKNQEDKSKDEAPNEKDSKSFQVTTIEEVIEEFSEWLNEKIGFIQQSKIENPVGGQSNEVNKVLQQKPSLADVVMVNSKKKIGGEEIGGNETSENKASGNKSSENETGGNETGGNETGGNETSGNETGGNENSISTPVVDATTVINNDDNKAAVGGVKSNESSTVETNTKNEKLLSNGGNSNAKNKTKKRRTKNNKRKTSKNMKNKQKRRVTKKKSHKKEESQKRKTENTTRISKQA